MLVSGFLILFMLALPGGQPEGVAAGDAERAANTPAAAAAPTVRGDAGEAAGPVGQAGPGISDHDVQRLLEELDHPRFDVRQAATDQLCILGTSYLPLLVERYQAEPGYELKRRIRYVIENIYLRPLLSGKDGFLGVRVVQRVLTRVHDPERDNPVHGLMIEEVMAGYAAQRGGLMTGDIIISLNGEPLPEDPAPTSFIARISSTPPETELSLRVLRMSSDPRLVEVPPAQPQPPALPQRGNALEGATLESTPKGVLIVDVAAGSPAAAMGMKPNTFIRSVNARNLTSPTAGTPDLERALAAARADEALALNLGDAEVVSLKVTLGSRPVELMQALDWREAQSRFIQWWQDQGGELFQRPAEQTRGPVILHHVQQPPVPEILLVP
jgi:hypothetical protein